MNPVVICAVPYVDTKDPIMAPAVLKSALVNAGIKSVAIDLNIEIVNIVNNHPRRQELLNLFFSQQVDKTVTKDLINLIDYCANRIVKFNPQIVALSLLVYTCQTFTRWLCLAIRRKHKCKIVIGGSGIKNFIADSDDDFCQQVTQSGLVDDFIAGDGEISFVEYCKGNVSYPGINTWNWQPIKNLNDLPYPDYKDYKFDQYRKKALPLNDSRGCVRQCEFCDIIEYWKKFQYRSAENIFSEMLYQASKYNIRDFQLRNSLSNGNMKEFRKLIDLIAHYNTGKNTDQQLSWNGYFIIRGATQHPEDLWRKLKITNATLSIGIESVVPHVRHRMGKVFENEDIDYHLAMAQKHSVPLVLLMMVGYPTETLADFEFTKQWFKDRKQYAANSVIMLNLSFASILPGTKLFRNRESMNIKTGSIPSIWINQNLNITSTQRKQYLLDLQNICRDECGFNTATNEETIKHTIDTLH